MPGPGMDRPPLPSPGVQSQMGVPQPPQDVSGGLSAIAQRNQQPGTLGQGGAPNPHGFLMSQVEAIKKVLEQIASAEPVFAPFAQKATEVLDTGVSAVSVAPTGEQAAPPEQATGGPTPPAGAGYSGPPMG